MVTSCPYLQHARWFQGFDWEGLKKRTMVPPIVPNVSYTPVMIINYLDNYM